MCNIFVQVRKNQGTLLWHTTRAAAMYLVIALLLLMHTPWVIDCHCHRIVWLPRWDWCGQCGQAGKVRGPKRKEALGWMHVADFIRFRHLVLVLRPGVAVLNNFGTAKKHMLSS